MIEIKDFSNNLKYDNGIYISKQESNISYPKEGNVLCMQIEEDSFWFKHRNDCIIHLVKKYSPNRIFFDIGGGNGFVSQGLERAGIKTVLVEPGREGTENAKKRGLKFIIRSTLEDANFKKSSIPTLGLFDVLEHIKEEKDFLKKIHAYIEDNGLLYLTVPSYNLLWSKEDTMGGHYRRYTRKELHSKLREAGFETIYSTYIFSILPIPIYLFRTVPSKLGFSPNAIEYENHKKVHKAPKSNLISGLMNKVWAYELNNINKNKSINFGGSCLLVARKVNS